MIGKTVEYSAYNPVSNVVGFHVGDLRVVIGKNRMDVYGTEDEEKVLGILDFIIGKISEISPGGEK